MRTGAQHQPSSTNASRLRGGSTTWYWSFWLTARPSMTHVGGMGKWWTDAASRKAFRAIRAMPCASSLLTVVTFWAPFAAVWPSLSRQPAQIAACSAFGSR